MLEWTQFTWKFVDRIDGPVRPMPYSGTGKLYKVTEVVLYLNATMPEPVPLAELSGTMAAVEVRDVTITGQVLKKDGTPGLATARESFYSWRNRHEHQDELGWLNEIVDTHLSHITFSGLTGARSGYKVGP
jgi:hypothetical protein